MSVAIKVENLSKAYQLGEIGTGTISRDLERWWARKRGKEDPFLKIGESNDRTVKGGSNVVWSLKDLNFEISQGDPIGIIGRNGAGKSTLLKLLSRVTAPTVGSIKAKGRIASLLEVGTGFHPDLTGRENIFLNGAILGMRKYEIKRKFDEIVEFAGVERYINTPVKRYSSGMYVRLAFAVAAHLESEILIVDEVLAVGDSEFQKKCLGKMGDVSKGEGRTVLFVSHQMGSIAQLCEKAILLNKGQVVAYSKTTEVIESYLSLGKTLSNKYKCAPEKQTQEYYFEELYTVNDRNEETDQFGFNETITVVMRIVAKQRYANVLLGLNLQNNLGGFVASTVNEFEYHRETGNYHYDFRVSMPSGIIAPNTYAFRFAIFSDGGKIYDMLEAECQLKINDTGTSLSRYEGLDYGNVILDFEWEKLN
ncbi:ABC transporter ATP-binding protein [Segetibacter sp. 3557_3]|uniref:ABC transporter ATP-binding protein n=1 Tax=Segetibacter sp. 3557_3 TaxID=2547429 RepID=UPI001058C61A|nr:ABC transporter ATP-binding protein [Segetibacter sp. 3557_3]TDH23288.1 ABC transporter ATP-binding protein [Segetibacter sp. 3557_3]